MLRKSIGYQNHQVLFVKKPINPDETKSLTTMISSKAPDKTNSKTELFADSFDSWIAPTEASPSDNSLQMPQDAPNGMKWAVWTEEETVHSWPSEETDVFQSEQPTQNAERALRGFALFIAGLTSLVLLASLFSFGVSKLRKPAITKTALPPISAQQRTKWQKSIRQNAFELARLQAKEQKRSLSANEKQGAAQKALLQTVNAGGPDYASFAAAQNAGAINNALWTLAFQGASRGGSLPVPTVRRVAAAPTRTRSTTPRRRKIARITRHRAPEKHAMILGRGPIREDNSSIILIRD